MGCFETFSLHLCHFYPLFAQYVPHFTAFFLILKAAAAPERPRPSAVVRLRRVCIYLPFLVVFSAFSFLTTPLPCLYYPFFTIFGPQTAAFPAGRGGVFFDFHLLVLPRGNFCLSQTASAPPLWGRPTAKGPRGVKCFYLSFFRPPAPPSARRAGAAQTRQKWSRHETPLIFHFLVPSDWKFCPYFPGNPHTPAPLPRLFLTFFAGGRCEGGGLYRAS
jgi:hypothetical protein